MENGDNVTRAELQAHLDPMRADIKEIKEDQKAQSIEMRLGFKLIADSQWLGPQGRTFLAGGSLLASAVAIFVALFFH